MKLKTTEEYLHDPVLKKLDQMSEIIKNMHKSFKEAHINCKHAYTHETK